MSNLFSTDFAGRSISLKANYVAGQADGAILAPYSSSSPNNAAADCALVARIAALREQGEVVVELLPGKSGSEGPLCDRRLVESKGQWIIQALNRN